MTIAHISDLHLNFHGKHTNYKKVERLLAEITSLEPEHLIISGDISENGCMQDFYFLRELLVKFNYLDSALTTIIIGNHDIYGTPPTIEDALAYPDRCKQTDYDLHLRRFHSFFEELNINTYRFSENEIYPFLKNVGNLFILAVNSIEEFSTRNFAASNGKVKKDQRQKALWLLDRYVPQGNQLILTLHHHFYKIKRQKDTFAGHILAKIENSTMKLRKSKKLIATFEKWGISHILHGHFQEQRIYEIGNIKLSNSGGSIKNGLGSIAQFNLLEFTDEGDFMNTFVINTELKETPV
jgi:3',5'-cyclic AMP phosphodiesterase CpdA